MNSWIFQGNPDVFNIDHYIASKDKVLWSVRQKHFADRMAEGDEVFFWRASGKTTQAVAGVIAYGRIISKPKMIPDDPAARSNTTDEVDGQREELRVQCEILQRCLRPEQVIKRQWVKGDPILKDLRILKMRTATNYLLKSHEADRLVSLVRNTGRVWTREECIAALWAYKETLGKTVYKEEGEPVSNVAVLLGRAVNVVHNRVMNFRYIDPRAEGGLPPAETTDQQVWDEFYNTDRGELDKARLDQEFHALWGVGSQQIAKEKPQYSDFGEAPDDDPEQLHLFAARVRRGQPQFRKNLLYLYDGKCAITGWGPPNVLEAAHIVRHSKTGRNHSDNGLLLRADIHYLFDEGLIRVEPDSLTVVVDESLSDSPYWDLNGVALRSRVDGSNPGKEYLKAKWNEVNSKSRGSY